jgi:hypothetical protein
MCVTIKTAVHDPVAQKTYTACVGCHECSASVFHHHGIHEGIQSLVSDVSMVNSVDFLDALAHGLNDHCVGSNGHSLPEEITITLNS